MSKKEKLPGSAWKFGQRLNVRLHYRIHNPTFTRSIDDSTRERNITSGRIFGDFFGNESVLILNEPLESAVHFLQIFLILLTLFLDRGADVCRPLLIRRRLSIHDLALALDNFLSLEFYNITE